MEIDKKAWRERLIFVIVIVVFRNLDVLLRLIETMTFMENFICGYFHGL